MKVVSLVPSWTETLINANINVVGRTRFCIHPKQSIKNIAALGGTKSVDWSRLKDTPDLVIMDKEENTREMAEGCPYPYYATHIKTLEDVPKELFVLADLINSHELLIKAQEWMELIKSNRKISIERLEAVGALKWWRKEISKPKHILYLIWKAPYMSVGQRTFIYSVFKFLGIDLYPFKEDYPEVDLSQFSKKDTCLLLSSEPFPFHRKKQELMALGYDCAWIDGELFSWYGDRSFKFLSQL